MVCTGLRSQPTAFLSLPVCCAFVSTTVHRSDLGSKVMLVPVKPVRRNVFNRGVRRLTLMGVSILGSCDLRIKGHTNGWWCCTPVRC